jgi:hypothetical protein
MRDFILAMIFYTGWFLMWAGALIGFCELLKALSTMRRSVFPCQHEWYGFAPYKRRCEKCGEEQWVMENRYPAIGEARYEWKTMHTMNGQRK